MTPYEQLKAAAPCKTCLGGQRGNQLLTMPPRNASCPFCRDTHLDFSALLAAVEAQNVLVPRIEELIVNACRFIPEGAEALRDIEMALSEIAAVKPPYRRQAPNEHQ